LYGASHSPPAPLGTLVEGLLRPPVNTVYVIAVMTSLNCGVDVLCLRAVEPDLTHQHAETYPTEQACIAARDRFLAEHDATHHRDLRCVPQDAALPYNSESDR
jgi:hypothetical protein